MLKYLSALMTRLPDEVVTVTSVSISAGVGMGLTEVILGYYVEETFYSFKEDYEFYDVIDMRVIALDATQRRLEEIPAQGRMENGPEDGEEEHGGVSIT
jgi:hypothetical protein